MLWDIPCTRKTSKIAPNTVTQTIINVSIFNRLFWNEVLRDFSHLKRGTRPLMKFWPESLWYRNVFYSISIIRLSRVPVCLRLILSARSHGDDFWEQFQSIRSYHLRFYDVTVHIHLFQILEQINVIRSQIFHIDPLGMFWSIWKEAFVQSDWRPFAKRHLFISSFFNKKKVLPQTPFLRLGVWENGCKRGVLDALNYRCIDIRFDRIYHGTLIACYSSLRRQNSRLTRDYAEFFGDPRWFQKSGPWDERKDPVETEFSKYPFLMTGLVFSTLFW